MAPAKHGKMEDDDHDAEVDLGWRRSLACAAFVAVACGGGGGSKTETPTSTRRRRPARPRRRAAGTPASGQRPLPADATVSAGTLRRLARQRRPAAVAPATGSTAAATASAARYDVQAAEARRRMSHRWHADADGPSGGLDGPIGHDDRQRGGGGGRSRGSRLDRTLRTARWADADQLISRRTLVASFLAGETLSFFSQRDVRTRPRQARSTARSKRRAASQQPGELARAFGTHLHEPGRRHRRAVRRTRRWRMARSRRR